MVFLWKPRLALFIDHKVSYSSSQVRPPNLECSIYRAVHFAQMDGGKKRPVAFHTSRDCVIGRQKSGPCPRSLSSRPLDIVICKAQYSGSRLFGRRMYRGRGIYWVKGSVPVLFWNLDHRGERERKGREYKFQNKAHRTFDPRNTSTPVDQL